MVFLLFSVVIALVLAGYPVAFTLAGVSLLFAFAGIAAGTFDPGLLQALNSRLYGIMVNGTLIAVPLFIFMGVAMQRSRIAENLLLALGDLFGCLRGGLGIAVVLVGALLAASTGIVGATVVTLGLLSLPVMLKRGYDPKIACGVICASGTLGQIIPPSIVLILLGDVMSSAYLKAQLHQGIFSPQSVSVIDLFAGALLPGLILVLLYTVYLSAVALFRPQYLPERARSETSQPPDFAHLLKALFAPLFLIVSVLGSILTGIATPTEAASVGAVGVLTLTALQKQMSPQKLKEIVRTSTRMTCMVFMILIGASFFSLVFRGFGGDEIVHQVLSQLPGGAAGAMLAVMLLMFAMGFILDFIEITLLVVPIVGPVLLSMGLDPVWLGVMIAINLQTSFLTPPFGFSLFYLRGVAPATVKTQQIYLGVAPFIVLQITMLVVLALWPQLATWLPGRLFRG